MRHILHLLLLTFTSNLSFSQEKPLYLDNQTVTFDQAVETYTLLSLIAPSYCAMKEMGPSDYGPPISLFLINKSGEFTKEAIQQKSVLLINNAIHPGEPCGVDASIELAKDLIENPERIPENVVIAIIPLYNVGGAHNRNCCSRANQNGPLEYGFRGNAKNLDLNRDFIKADSKNTRTFYRIFHYLNPSVFIDSHTSNGADYQHTMTLITSQVNKMTPIISDYTTKSIQPYLFTQMEKDGFPMAPYVHSIGKTPDKGIIDYLETPRYSTGYTNLFNTISFVTEAHMLKPYADRVKSTRLFFDHMIEFMESNAQKLNEIRKAADNYNATATELPLNWKLDTTQFDTISFLGYTAEYKKSEVTQQDRLFYNQNKPYKKDIPYYNYYRAEDKVSVPRYYIIPKAWRDIIPLLQLNEIEIFQLNQDQSIPSELYYIDDYKTRKSPYEGHYLHYNVSTTTLKRAIDYKKGDYVIPVRGKSVRYLLETLEPIAPDSYFAWNYFDAVLQQKEWFSAYVFEDEAATLLANDKALAKAFEEKKQSDSTFAASSFSQLYYLYKQTPHFESTRNLYPVTRIQEVIKPELLTPVSR